MTDAHTGFGDLARRSLLPGESDADRAVSRCESGRMDVYELRVGPDERGLFGELRSRETRDEDRSAGSSAGWVGRTSRHSRTNRTSFRPPSLASRATSGVFDSSLS